MGHLVNCTRKAAIGLAIAGLTLGTAVFANGDDEFIAAYQSNKPTPGGITPDSRRELVRCWMVWKRLGDMFIQSGDTFTEMHPDFSAANADSLFQHWWARAEQSYGPKLERRMLDNAQEVDDYFHDSSKLMELMRAGGACYVPDGERRAFDRPRSLAVFLDGSSAPSQAASSSASSVRPMFALPSNMLQNIQDGTIDVNKGRRFRGLQRVLVPHFAVSYGLGDQSSTRANSRNVYGAGTSVAISTEITGLTEPMLQSLTDMAFEDFKRQMAQYGYEVITGAEAQQMLLNAQRLRRTTVHNGMVREMSVYHNAFNGNFLDATFAPTGMRLIDPMWEASVASQQLDIPSLNVQYSVHFAWFDGSSSYDRRAFSGNEAMSSSMGLNLNVQVIYSSGIEIMGSTADNPKVSVNEAFFSGNRFTRNIDQQRSGSGDRLRAYYAVAADPEAYYVEAAKTLSRSNTALISQMASLR